MLLQVDGPHYEICERSSLSSILALSEVDTKSRIYAQTYFKDLARKIGFSEEISYSNYEVSQEYTFLKQLVQRVCGLFFAIHKSNSVSTNNFIDSAYNLLLNPEELLSYDIITLIDFCLNKVNESIEISYYSAYALSDLNSLLEYQPTLQELCRLKVQVTYENRLSAVQLEVILLLAKQCESHFLQNAVMNIFLDHYQDLDVEERRPMILTSLSYLPFITAMNIAGPKSLLFTLILYLNGLFCCMNKERFKPLHDTLFKFPDEFFSSEVSVNQVIDLFASSETIDAGYKELTPLRLCEIHSNREGVEHISQLKREYDLRNY